MLSSTSGSFHHIYWLAGSPCAGKSTISHLLGEQFGLQVYSVDEQFERHSQTFTPQQQPVLYRWTHTSWNDLWAQPIEARWSTG